MGKIERKEYRLGATDGFGSVDFKKDLGGRWARARGDVDTPIWTEGRVDGDTGTLGCDDIPIGGRCNCTRVGEITIVDGGDSGTERRGVGATMTERRRGSGGTASGGRAETGESI